MTCQPVDLHDGPGMYAAACSVVQTQLRPIGHGDMAVNTEQRTVLLVTVTQSKAEAENEVRTEATAQFPPADGWQGYMVTATKIIVRLRGDGNPIVIDERTRIER